MGYNARLENALLVLSALEDVLDGQGHRVERGAGVAAARAWTGAAIRSASD
jgi:aspartate aminotransferase-like enzyme